MKNSRCIVAVLIIILSTFVLETQGSTCTATGITQDFIQTGIVAFSTSSTSPSTSLITGSPNREYCGQVTVQFRPTSVGLSWLFAISDFGTFSPSTSGSDYSVSGKASTTSTTIVIVTLLIGGSWTNILVSYLIESRTDLYTGTFLVGGASTFDCQQSGDQVVMGSYVIPNWTPITQADVLFKQIFVSGIRTQTQALSLSLNPTFNPSTGVFTVTINLGVNSFVQMFQISFIIQQTNFQPLQTTLKFIYLSGNRPGGDYNFVGAVSYGTSGLVPSFGTIQIFADRYACVGSGCGTQICVTHDQCTAFSGIVSGVNCFACGATQVFSPTTSNCVCKPTFTQTPDGNCIQCPLNAHYNTVTKTCECDTDFTLNAANQCISHDCPYLQSWSTDLGRCQCIVKFMTLSGGNCICPDGQTYNSVTQNCVCKPGYIISSTQASGQLNCVQCPELSLPDSTLTTCQCIDAYYKRRSGDPCIRIPNCGPLALWSPTTFTCTCTISYMIQDATGVCQCPTNQVYSSDTKSCRCQPGSYISVQATTTTGITCTICGSNSIVNTDQRGCTCVNGYYSSTIGGVTTCVQNPNCPAGSTLNPRLTPPTCVCDIAAQIYNSITNLCSCPVNSIVSTVNGVSTCVCNGVSVSKATGVCQPCPENSSPVNNVCTCNNGYFQKPTGCVRLPPQCYLNGVTINPDGTCVCNNKELTLTQRGCSCPGTLIEINNVCTCPAGLIQSGTNCYACQPQSTYSPDTKKCQCIQGYYASDPFTCTLIPSCFPGAVFDVNLKFCKCTNPAFVLTHIGCTCPSGMQNTVDNKCFCSLTAPFDNNNCLCVPGAQYSLTSQSCIPPITGTSVAIYGSSCTVNQLLLGMCVSLFPDKTDPTTCTCTISLKILMLTPGFNPTVKVNPVDTFPGCFILQLTAPSISKKTFTFQTIVKQDPTGTTTTGGTTTTTTTSNTQFYGPIFNYQAGSSTYVNTPLSNLLGNQRATLVLDMNTKPPTTIKILTDTDKKAYFYGHYPLGRNVQPPFQLVNEQSQV